MTTESTPLRGIRAIGLLNNWEVFGHEKGCLEWFQSLRRQGAEVKVGVTTMEAGGLLKQLVIERGFDTFDIPYGCQWSKQFFSREPWLIATNLWKIARCSKIMSQQMTRQKTTHILIGNALVYSYVAPALWAHKQVKLIYRMGDEPSHDSKPNLWIWKKCFKRSSLVVANSQFVAASIEKAVGKSDKIRIIYNIAPSTDVLEPNDDITPLTRDRLKRILFVGQISTHKGIDLLVRATIPICQNDPEIKLDIVGGSAYSRQLENELKQHVANAGVKSQIIFHGHIKDPAIFYRNSSILVVPSMFEEPAANVVLEAKKFGVPAIIFRSGGLPELIEPGRTGIVCSHRTTESLHFTIKELLGDIELLTSMQANCRLEYERRFSQSRFDNEWSNAIVT
jgi:glycosyltransferase involved in cell wall biosynthesis